MFYDKGWELNAITVMFVLNGISLFFLRVAIKVGYFANTLMQLIYSGV